MNTSEKPQVIVIGAGLGGLSAAISLASEGFPVTILEKNDKVGGKLNILRQDGFSFDLGPSILTMPHIFEALFTRAGRRMSDYLTIQTVEPHWRNFFEDGATIDLCADPEAQRRELDKLGPEVHAQFQRFMDYSQKLGQLTEAGYFKHGLETVLDLVRFHGLGSLGFDLFRNMDQGVRRYIKHPKLADILNYFIKYVGASPYTAPALMNLLPYVQYHYGLWYAPGGMYALAEALLRLAAELGVEVRVNAEVTAIEHANGKANGVRLSDGSQLKADILVSNMEVIPAMKRLLNSAPEQLHKMRRFQPTCSGLVLHLGVNRLYPQLAHHNFFYSQDSRKHFAAVFEERRLSEDPTIYLVAPCKSDPNIAPPGCEIIKILPHIPHLDPERPLSDADYLALRERVLVKLERMGLTDLRQHIVTEDMWTPLDIEQRYYSNQGSIYGVISHRTLNLGLKAPRRDSQIGNLYYVGGSVNPGGGMPMAALSGQLARDRILADLFPGAG